MPQSLASLHWHVSDSQSRDLSVNMSVGFQITCGGKDLERKDLGGLGRSGIIASLNDFSYLFNCRSFFACVR
jgi:hypothetical protein